MIAAVRMTTILKQFPSVEGDGAHMLLRVPQIVTQNFGFDEVYHVFLYLCPLSPAHRFRPILAGSVGDQKFRKEEYRL